MAHATNVPVEQLKSLLTRAIVSSAEKIDWAGNFSKWRELPEVSE